MFVCGRVNVFPQHRCEAALCPDLTYYNFPKCMRVWENRTALKFTCHIKTGLSTSHSFDSMLCLSICFLKFTPPPPHLHVRRRCLWNQAEMGEVSQSLTKEELLCGLALIWDRYQLPNHESVYSWSIQKYDYSLYFKEKHLKAKSICGIRLLKPDKKVYYYSCFAYYDSVSKSTQMQNGSNLL